MAPDRAFRDRDCSGLDGIRAVHSPIATSSRAFAPIIAADFFPIWSERSDMSGQRRVLSWQRKGRERD
jgi:hypothetical protein